jgi:hypothetical protein
MSASMLLNAIKADATGPEISIRVIGNRETPSRMSIQVGITGTANVRIQARVARDAPWLDIGPTYSTSALAYIEPAPFLRAVASEMAAGSSVSVWGVWAW